MKYFIGEGSSLWNIGHVITAESGVKHNKSMKSIYMYGLSLQTIAN
jgi:hypothetical protein